MSDNDTSDQTQDNLPPQESAEDTSNWENKPVDAPDGKLHIHSLEPDTNPPD